MLSEQTESGSADDDKYQRGHQQFHQRETTVSAIAGYCFHGFHGRTIVI
jgi:hypothetical protein